MANRFTNYSRQKYYELPVDAYQQALGVQEARTSREANDLSQNVQFIKNLPAVNGPDKLRLEQIVSGLEQGIQGVAKKDLSSAETLNELNTLVGDRVTNQDAVGIYQNVLGYRKKQKAIDDYEKKFGNNVNTTRLRSQLNSYVNQNDPTKFKAGYFDSLSDPIDYQDIPKDIEDTIAKFKASKQSGEYVNGNYITKKSIEGLTEDQLYNKISQLYSNNPKYSNQFRENAYYDAYNAGGGDPTKGYQVISNSYLSGLESQYKNLEGMLASKKYTPKQKTEINQRLLEVKNSRDQIKQQLEAGNYEGVTLNKTKDDLLRNSSQPFAYMQEENSMKADPFALMREREYLDFSYWNKKQKILKENSLAPVSISTVFDGLDDSQAGVVANDQIKTIFGLPVNLSSDGTKFDMNNNAAKNSRLENYKKEEEAILADIRRKTGSTGGFFDNVYNSKEYKDRVAEAAKKYGIKTRGGISTFFKDGSPIYADDMPQDNAKIHKKLEELSISNPELKRFTDRKDYVGAYKHYRDALVNNQKVIKGFELNESTGYGQKRLNNLLTGIVNQPVITATGKQTNSINDALVEIGAIHEKSTGGEIDRVLFSPNNKYVLRQDGRLSVEVSTPTGRQRILVTPPAEMLRDVQPFMEMSNSTNQGIMNVNIGGRNANVISTPRISDGKLQQLLFTPVSGYEQIAGSHKGANFNKTNTYKELVKAIGEKAAQNAFSELSKVSNKGSMTVVFDEKGNINPSSNSGFGITINNAGGRRTLNLSRPLGMSADQLFELKFKDMNNQGGSLFNYRAPSKVKSSSFPQIESQDNLVDSYIESEDSDE